MLKDGLKVVIWRSRESGLSFSLVRGSKLFPSFIPFPKDFNSMALINLSNKGAKKRSRLLLVRSLLERLRKFGFF